MEELSVRNARKKDYKGPTAIDFSFVLRNMFIDNTGITFSARAENVFVGTVMAILTVGLYPRYHLFWHSAKQFPKSGFNGKIGLPIAEQSQYMLYQAELNTEETHLILWCRLGPWQYQNSNLWRSSH